MERPWKEALAIYRSRLMWLLGVGAASVAIGVLLVCAASLEQLSPRGQFRSWAFALAWIFFVQIVSRMVVWWRKRKLSLVQRHEELVQQREQIEQLQTEFAKTLEQLDLELPQQAKIEAPISLSTAKKLTDQIIVGEEADIIRAKEQFFSQVVAAIKISKQQGDKKRAQMSQELHNFRWSPLRTTGK